MELTQATPADYDRIAAFYRHVIDHTENADIYCRWKYGLHPSDGMIRDYIRDGLLYIWAEGGSILAAAAVEPQQGEDYRSTEWSLPLADEEVAVVHLLCVEPQRQKQGLAGKFMRQILDLAGRMGKKAIRLDAISCNLPAQLLYESLGFSRRGTQRWYAGNTGWIDFYLYEIIL